MITAFSFIIAQVRGIGNKKRAVDNRPYNENPPFPNVGADIIRPLGCSVQHIFYEDAVTRCGVIHKDVGHGADEFALLDDGAAGHARVNIGPTHFLYYLFSKLSLKLKGIAPN